MNIYEKIYNELRAEYSERGMTQQEIARIAGVHQVSVGRYLNNADNIKSMRLETLFSLFPDADIVFSHPMNEDLKARLHQIIDSLDDDEARKTMIFFDKILGKH
ncbi:MAG: helix-turn-helix transcriptional regulator [Victivallaceae bacterium]|nr:helix-turn-helix transcriptional regulator [Victivallaceae bacterium]